MNKKGFILSDEEIRSFINNFNKDISKNYNDFHEKTKKLLSVPERRLRFQQ